MELVILAGGKGTRLGYKNIPKPMVRVGGIPILERQVRQARKYGITKIYILSGYRNEAITSYFKDGSKFGVTIEHVVETSPLGTAGSLKQLESKLKSRFLVFYGDTIFDIDLARFMSFDAARSTLGTVFAHPNDHPYDSDLFSADASGKILRFFPKPHAAGRYYPNLVNAALYILDPEIFKYIPPGRPSDFGRDIFPKIVRAGGALIAYRSPEYIKDMGTPERLAKIRKDLASGKISRLNLRNKRRAVFLDRDGVINEDCGNIAKVRDFKLLPGVAEAIKKLNSSEYLAVLVTNQPVLAKGFCSEETLKRIHMKMETLLGKSGAYFDGIYFCPHHPEKGFPGEVRSLKIDCTCRKPKPGMLHQAAADCNIDLSKSFMIGDRPSDISAGKAAGAKTVLLLSASAPAGPTGAVPDLTAASVSEAVDYVLKEKR